MSLEDSDILDDCDGKALSVSCSICLELVSDNGDRSWAKLRCGHQFHLDCIFSAFNIKGEMQCPNCRKIEKDRWLLPSDEYSMDDWAHDEDLYDLSHSWMSFGVHRRPFIGLPRRPLSVDSAARAGSSKASPVIPPYPGRVARARDRARRAWARDRVREYFQQPSNSPPVRTPIMSGTPRSSSHRRVTQVGPVDSSSDQTGGFYLYPPASSGQNFPEAENHPMSNHFHEWEREHVTSFPLSQGDRDLGWGPFHQAGGGSDTAIRSTSFPQRFQEAEDDCTEALNLDDREIKAYSRRSTARKEPGKLKESIEDAEFSLRLEPHNQEIKKQYAETESLYEKEILNEASGALRSSVQKVGKSKVEVNGHVGAVQSVSRSSQKMVTAAIQEDHNKDSDGQVPAKTSISIEEIENKSMRSKGQEANASCEDGVQSSGLESSKKNHKKQELKASVQELAARAASRAMAEAAKNITPPNSAYQFEVSWQGLAGDRALQARLLKVTSPVALPQIFKNAMSARMLVDIIRCIATFFTEEMDLAVKYLENLAKVSRFDIIMMCFSPTDRADLQRIWDDVFCNNATPMEYAERLDKLRSRYCRKQ
ncbi:E3 ubiquitin-protein ligase RFI2 [Camellia lanceoleosa]|uniref:E3 ubiquitin-protein ligase RFI2 n=1 Tax=Camellia lanceoleosa TaxID=1840588 RepID=A0ACC0IKS3_9ERIC|nr:E3 ubiquitin-protein ligase RFI2 [Camellia lanceoleosa]